MSFQNSQLSQTLKAETRHLLLDEPLGFYRPEASRNLAAIFPTILQWLGRPQPGLPTLGQWLPPATPQRAKKVFLLTIDSMGFKELYHGGGFYQLYGDHGAWISSVFPTITSAAITSIYQGLLPARHGIMGHVIYKQPPGALVDTLKMQLDGQGVSVSQAGVNPRSWKREPGVWEGLAGGDLSGVMLMSSHIAGSGLSAYCHQNSRILAFSHELEAARKGARLLEEIQSGWVSLYLSGVDYLIHAYGGESAEVSQALHQVWENLALMAGEMSAKAVEETLLVVAADHGQEEITQRLPLAGDQLDWLLAHTKALGFSGRLMHVYLQPEQTPAQEAMLVARLEALVGQAGVVYPFSQAGPWCGQTDDPAWVRASMGDWLVVLKQGWYWDKTGTPLDHTKYANPAVSQHGGLCWNEMFVPLIAAPLARVLDMEGAGGG